MCVPTTLALMHVSIGVCIRRLLHEYYPIATFNPPLLCVRACDTHAYTYTHMCTHMYTNASLQSAHCDTHTHTRIHLHAHAHKYIHVYKHMHVHTRNCKHTQRCTHTHAPTRDGYKAFGEGRLDNGLAIPFNDCTEGWMAH